MKRILLLFILLITTAQTIQSQTVVLDTNGVTLKWTGTTVPSPYFVQANPRGTGMEWFAIVNNSTTINISNYAKNIQSGITFFTPPSGTTPIPFNNIVTTLVTNMNQLFYLASSFNQPISSWDVSNVVDMSGMFGSTAFNQPLGSWDVSNVTTMGNMFLNASIFNQPIGNWNVINVTNMFGMFKRASAFNQPINSWNVGNVTNMSQMFFYATIFNQPISSWNVSGVTNMNSMFYQATSFNQNIGSWNVSNVMDMFGMFYNATAFNQSIGNWNVSNVLDMGGMFGGATNFNQPIGNWNMSNVILMDEMFWNASSFNQPIGSWNVSNVTDMRSMFQEAFIFDQPLGSWNVGNVTRMDNMFLGTRLSTANYDELLIGWSTISPNETPLRSNVVFSGGNSKYCNGASARNILDFTPNNWTITDGGLDCSSLDTDEFETNTLKLYPNPVVNILNIKTDHNHINQPFTIIDGLGRVVLNGKLNEVDTVINVEQLSKGIYYLKVSGNSANKFIKE
jgi:surface protein